MTASLLNDPYGGALVQRLTESVERLADPAIVVDDVVESDLVNLGVGAFSPLTGFMDAADFTAVCESRCLDRSRLPWTIPIVCDISRGERDAIAGASRVFLQSATSGQDVGFIEPQEIFPHDRARHIASVFGTSDPGHPGVRRVMEMKEFLLAGPVTVFRDALMSDPLRYPSGVRAQLDSLGLSTVAGFQTRNIVHRAHEYLQRVALELVGALLVQPVIGWKKPGDFRPEVVQTAYRRFIDEYFPRDRTLLAFLKLAMRYAGPREAVLHAIVRKNYGCSHFIVGRDHAGVGGFYPTYAAHEIFDGLPHLGIEILRLREPFFCSRCGVITSDRACGHSNADRQFISGTQVRKALSDGFDLTGHVMRKEVLDAISVFPREALLYE